MTAKKPKEAKVKPAATPAKAPPAKVQAAKVEAAPARPATKPLHRVGKPSNPFLAMNPPAKMRPP
jgi:hypothetical protein